MYCGTALWKTKTSSELTKRKLRTGQIIETYPSLPNNLYDALRNTAETFPAKPAIIDHYEHSYTYQDLLDKTDVFASYLYKEINIQKGHHVALMLYNSVEFCISFLALSKLGAIAVPLPTKYKKQEVFSLINQSDVHCIICDEDFYDWFSAYENRGIHRILSLNAESGYGFSSYTSSCQVPPSSIGFLEDDAIIMFTSGTTSQSKGVVIKNYNILHAILAYKETLQITSNDISMIPIPIYHITGMVALFGLFIYCGGTLVLHKYFNAQRVLTDAIKYHVSFLHASPTVFSMLLEEAESFPSLPDLKSLACGSSNMPKEKLIRIHNWLPHTTFHTVYGLTETTSPATVFPTDASTSTYIGSSGLPIPGTCFEIRSDDGLPLSTGEIGEIWISGSVVLSSYYKKETSSLKDGWLGTGDLGYFNEDGYLFVVDRKKDMINRGGEKIWCFDVENEIYQFENVKEAAVVGIPDEVYGEVAAAIIRPVPGKTLNISELHAFLLTRMAKYKVPQKILITDKIPVTPNGKIDKQKIRTLFTQS